MYTYILVYDTETADRETMKNCLNSIPAILGWRYDMPNSFFLYSNETANYLTASLASHITNYKCFIFVELSTNKQGYLRKETWNFINQSSN